MYLVDNYIPIYLIQEISFKKDKRRRLNESVFCNMCLDSE